MSQTLRHFSIRIWLTILGGGLLSLWWMPYFQSKLGLQWIILPALIICLAIYLGIGALFNRLGINFMQRALGEATSWERVGMNKEARRGYAAALSVFDSFLFSPMVRRSHSGRLASRLARFSLANFRSEAEALDYVVAYLDANPYDREVAENWLELMLKQDEFPAACHEVAQKIGAALPQERRLGLLLVHFYLATNRTDFEAEQAYRSVIARGGRAADDIARKLATLFITEGRADEWALNVYLRALKGQEPPDDILSGLAACMRWVKPTDQTEGLLAAARKVLQEPDADTIVRMSQGFQPPVVKTLPKPAPSPRKRAGLDLGKLVRTCIAHLSTAWTHGTDLGRGLFRQIQILVAARQARTALKWGALALGFAGVIFLVVNTVSHLLPRSDPPPANPTVTSVPAVEVVPDPFTLQVAAYNRLEDAKRYVASLKAKGLDVYWTEAVGANRKWYQVRVSHFPDKAAARKYGDSLKARRLIDDYYVANNKRP